LRIFAPVCGSTHWFSRNWPFGNGLDTEIALGRAFLPPSNAAPDAGTLIRRRRIGLPAAERAFDGVETASSRLGLNPTASDQRPGGWTGIRRGRINVPPPDWAFDGRGKPVFPAECQFDARGNAVSVTECRFDAVETGSGRRRVASPGAESRAVRRCCFRRRMNALGTAAGHRPAPRGEAYGITLMVCSTSCLNSTPAAVLS
jgi:hypothetical protein